MFGPHTPEEASLARQQLLEKFASFRSRVDAGPDEILDWIADNINTLSHKLLGQETRLVDEGSSSWYTRVRVEGGIPYVVFDVAWQFDEDEKQTPPDVKMILHDLPGIEVTTDQLQVSELSACLKFDLCSWPHLVAHIAHVKAHFALIDGKGFPQAQAAAIEDVLTLGSYFYPTLTKGMLSMGADLGMLESVDTFRAWCLTSKQSESTNLVMPQDL